MKRIISFLIILLFTFTLIGCSNNIELSIIDDYTESEFNELVEKLKLSTVLIEEYYLDYNLGHGSGLIYYREELDNNTYRYYVLTNNHVVKYGTRVVIKTYYKEEEGDVYASYDGDKDIPDNEDIAIIRFDSNIDYPLIDIIPFNEKKYLEVYKGQKVFAIGTPSYVENYNLVSNIGVISSISRNFISHTTNINAGNSGGPLFSIDGTFIGVNTQRIEYLENKNNELVYLISDSIDANQVAYMINKRLKEVTPRIGISILDYEKFININYQDITDGKNVIFDPFLYVPHGESGVVVLEVNSTRPSYGILNRYDLIKEVNGNPVYNVSQLAQEIGTISEGNTYEFKVIRKNPITNQFDNINLTVIIK